jgi:hypothetical protein
MLKTTRWFFEMTPWTAGWLQSAASQDFAPIRLQLITSNRERLEDRERELGGIRVSRRPFLKLYRYRHDQYRCHDGGSGRDATVMTSLLWAWILAFPLPVDADGSGRRCGSQRCFSGGLRSQPGHGARRRSVAQGRKKKKMALLWPVGPTWQPLSERVCDLGSRWTGWLGRISGPRSSGRFFYFFMFWFFPFSAFSFEILIWI